MKENDAVPSTRPALDPNRIRGCGDIPPAALVGISRTTFWKLYSEGRAPEPLRMSGRVVRWRRDEIAAWVAAGCPPREKWRYAP